MCESFDYSIKLGTVFTAHEGIDLTIDELDFPIRCGNFLKRAGIHDLQHLLLLSGDDVIRICPYKSKHLSCNAIFDKLCRMSDVEFELNEECIFDSFMGEEDIVDISDIY